MMISHEDPDDERAGCAMGPAMLLLGTVLLGGWLAARRIAMG